MKKVRTAPPAAPMSKAELEKLAEFRYQLRRFLRFSEEATKSRGVTMLQYLLLLQVKGFPGRDHASVGELAERLQAQQHGVVALVTRCEAAGLVARMPATHDRRRVDVRLTPRGEACLDELARLHRNELATLAGRFTVPDMGPVAAPPMPTRRAARSATTRRRTT